jgi:hypothetical protein
VHLLSTAANARWQLVANIINATQKPALAIGLQLHVTITVMPAAACIYRGGAVCVTSAQSVLAALSVF